MSAIDSAAGEPLNGRGSVRHSTTELAAVFVLYLASMVTFALLHPVLEWPDAEVHLTESCQRDVLFPSKALLEGLRQDTCAFSYQRPLGEFRFFADQTSASDSHALNPIWAYILIPLACLAGLFFSIAISGNQNAVGNPMVFAPPLAFYLSNVNSEIFGVFLIVLAYFILRRHRFVALFLTCLATAIDRSHVCSFVTILLLQFFSSARRNWLLKCFLLTVLGLYVARLAGFFAVLDVLALALDTVPVLGITGGDVLSNADYGSRGYAALLASAAGLYGAMSYRPVMWILYYGLFFAFLGVGFRQSNSEERKALAIAGAVALSIMIVLPPLSQARYYPILLIAMWSMVIRGGQWFGVRPLLLQLFFFSWTLVSVIAANVRHIVSN